MKKIKLYLYGRFFAVLLLAAMCFSCKKTVYNETVQFPQKVRMIEGQKCLLGVLLYEPYTETNGFLSSTIETGVNIYRFSSWRSNHPEIVLVENDTIYALSKGDAVVTGSYEDNVGSHEVACYVNVTNQGYTTIDNDLDTVFLTKGLEIHGLLDFYSSHTLFFEIEDTTCCKLSNIVSIPINYPGNTDSGTMTIIDVFTTLVHYNLTLRGLQDGTTIIRMFNDSAEIDVRIPIVVR
ncbi:MAG: hypothetical protein K5920_02645 [Bacteroidales bacterium]|nr:hypothetical protein [Bacteroidales bacterium]